MTNVGIGSHDRGFGDIEDSLYVKKEALRTKLSAKEAESFARSNSGAEAIIKDKDGTYSVYKLATDEDGKTILNSDFTNDNIELTSDVASKLSGNKAYVMTSDNVLRTFEFAGVELVSLTQDFVTADLSIDLEDKDGIETISKNDLEGKISGEITISKDLIEESLAALKRDGLGVEFRVNPSKNEYEIEISKGVSLGTINLKAHDGGITVRINASTGVNIAAGTLNTLAKIGSLGTSDSIDPEELLKIIIHSKLAYDLGFDARDVGTNKIRLEPNLKDNKLLGKLPVGDMNLYLEKVESTPGSVDISIANNGDIKIKLKDTKVTGSTNSEGGYIKKSDSEGSDKISTSVRGNLRNDMSASLSTQSSLSVNITDEEEAALGQRVKKLAGFEASAKGKLDISEIEVQAEIQSDGSFDVSKKGSGKINAKNIELTLGGNTINIDSTTGILGVDKDGDKTVINAGDVTLSGSVKSSYGNVEFKEIILDGKFIHDSKNPNHFKIESSKEKGIQATLDIKDEHGKTSFGIQKMALKGADIDYDSKSGSLTLKQKYSSIPVTVSELKTGEIDLKNIVFNGSLEFDPKSKEMILDTKSLEFNGKLGDVEIKDLKGSGKLIYHEENGIKIEGMNISKASGKIGDFDISRLSGKGDVSFDKDGNLIMSEATSLKLDSKSGLSISGALTVKHKDGNFNFQSNSWNPLTIGYGKKEKLVSDLAISGNIEYDSNNNTFKFNNKNRPLTIKKGEIYGVKFDNFKLEGEVNLSGEKVAISNSKGDVSFSGGIAGIKISEFKSSGNIELDKENSSVTWKDNVSLKIDEKDLEINTIGEFKLNKNKEGQYVFESNNGIINGKFGNTDFSDLKVNGKIIFDPKTKEIKLEGNTSSENSELELSGKIKGNDVDLKSSGSLSITQGDEGIKIKSNDVIVNGSISGFNLSAQKGIQGEVTLSNEGKLVDIKGFDFDYTVEGISLKSKGGLENTEEGYQIKLDGSVSARNGNLGNFFEKLSETSLIPEESKASMQKLAHYFGKAGLEELKYKDLTVNFDKNFGFESFKMTSNEIKLNFPDNNIHITSKGDLGFEIDKDFKINLANNNNQFNADLGKIQLRDFNIDSQFTYDPEVGKVSLKGVNQEDINITGKIDGKSVKLTGGAEINIFREGDGTRFSGQDIRFKGDLDGVNVESIGATKGSIIFKDDGHIDISNLKFAFKIDNSILTNTDGSIKSSDEGYELKFTGSFDSDRKDIIRFLEKVSSNKSTPKATKQSIDEIINTVGQYSVYGDLKNVSYNDFTIKLDKSFGFESFKVNTTGVMEDSSFKLESTDKESIYLGKLDLSANISSDNDTFKLKDGTISFQLTDKVKESIKAKAISMLEYMDFKDIDLTISDDGKMKINNATFHGIPIINIDFEFSAKFEGTKLAISLDDMKGFWGAIADVVNAFGGNAEGFSIEKGLAQINDYKFKYDKGQTMFYMDLQDVMYRISENMTLNDVSVSKDGRVTVLFEGSAGANKEFNPAIVNESTSKIKKLLGNKDNADEIKSILLSLSPQDLGRVLDRITLQALKATLKDDDKIIAVLTRIAQSQTTGHNSEHLRELSTFIDDDISYGLQRNLTNSELRDMIAETKSNLIKHLADGKTNEAEEKAIKRLILNSDAEDLSEVLDRVSTKLVKYELDDEDFLDVLKLLAHTSKIAHNETHFQSALQKSDDDLTESLLKSLSDTKLSSLSTTARAQMAKNLAKGKTNGDEEKAIKRIVETSSPKDMGKLIEKISAKVLRSEFDAQDYFDILILLYINSKVAGNERQFLDMLKESNDDITMAFLKSINDGQISDLSVSSRVQIVDNLASGHTNGDEEQAIKRTILASDKKDAGKIVDSVSNKRLKSELDDDDYRDVVRHSK